MSIARGTSTARVDSVLAHACTSSVALPSMDDLVAQIRAHHRARKGAPNAATGFAKLAKSAGAGTKVPADAVALYAATDGAMLFPQHETYDLSPLARLVPLAKLVGADRCPPQWLAFARVAEEGARVSLSRPREQGQAVRARAWISQARQRARACRSRGSSCRPHFSGAGASHERAGRNWRRRSCDSRRTGRRDWTGAPAVGGCRASRGRRVSAATLECGRPAPRARKSSCDRWSCALTRDRPARHRSVGRQAGPRSRALRAGPQARGGGGSPTAPRRSRSRQDRWPAPRRRASSARPCT